MPPKMITGISNAPIARTNFSHKFDSVKGVFSISGCLNPYLTATIIIAHPIRIPGVMPPINIDPTEASVQDEYEIMTVDGGMIQPSTPATATVPNANFFSYPAISIDGTMILPIAAQVAVGEPDKAPNNMHAKMETTPMPPGIQPRIESQKSVKRLEMPPADIKFPESMKSGIAIIVKLSNEPNIRCPKTIGCTSPVINTAAMPPPAKQRAIGKPSINRIPNTPNKTNAIILQSPPLSF